MALIHSKYPSDVLDYGFDWSSWLPTGDTIDTSVWIVDAGITVDSESETTTVTTAWLSGGTAGVAYNATNQIVTTPGGRTKELSLTINVLER